MGIARQLHHQAVTKTNFDFSQRMIPRFAYILCANPKPNLSASASSSPGPIYQLDLGCFFWPKRTHFSTQRLVLEAWDRMEADGTFERLGL